MLERKEGKSNSDQPTIDSGIPNFSPGIPSQTNLNEKQRKASDRGLAPAGGGKHSTRRQYTLAVRTKIQHRMRDAD